VNELLVPALTFVLAAGLALYVAPLLMRAALRYGIVDKPKPPLKLHKEPVPYLGGLVVLVAMITALAITFPFDQRVLAILLAASLVVIVGLVDDLGGLTPKDKLIGQLAAALVLVKAGVTIDIVGLPSPIDEIASVLWMLTCMNALNILDVSDGLATTAGFVGALGALCTAVLNGEPLVATLAASMAGACLGFLRVNRQPARMYLGDTGSLLLGTLLGALAIVGRYSDVNQVSLWFVPLSLLVVPLFDLALVIIARTLKGKPVWLGSPDHFAIRLKHAGMSAAGVARLAGALGLVVMALSVTSTRLQNREAARLLGGVAVVVIATLVWVLVKRPAPEPRAPVAPETTPTTPSGPAK
jgi:UDP-GlcNAc:undecaprenyl-phosphate GlcNAc-1-phosphate transferase